MLMDTVPAEVREQYENTRAKLKSKFAIYDAADQTRIKRVAADMVSSRIASGEIEESHEAIVLAMPQAMLDAMQTMSAANEFLCG